MNFQNNTDTKIKFKVVIGEGDSQTIKRLSKMPRDFNDLNQMVYTRFKDRIDSLGIRPDELGRVGHIFYKDIAHGMIMIENDTDLAAALDYCYLTNVKSLKLYRKFFSFTFCIFSLRFFYQNFF